MPKFLLIKKSRGALQSLLHFLFNCLLAFSTIFLTVLTGNPILGIIFVLVSKWRMFAVHPYYWLTNIRANLVDLIIGISLVLLALPSSTDSSDFLPIHILLIIFYTIWLVIIKPATSNTATEAQALISTFLGLNVVSIFFSKYNIIFTALSFFIIFSSVRHMLSQSEEEDFGFISFCTAILVTEISWILRFWLIIYNFQRLGVIISQIAIITTAIIFTLNRIHHSLIRHDGKLKLHDTLAPIAFSVIIIIVMLIWFSKPIFNI